MFKADLHLHSKEDYQDHMISYSAYELIDHMAKLDYKILSLTFHNQLYYSQDLVQYAKKKGILLIPGVELLVQNSHVLIYNAKPEELASIKTFSDLKKIRRKDTLIIASHPFFGINSIGKNIDQYPDAFDGIEYSHFYMQWFNRNKKAMKYMKKHSFIILGNSDAHQFKQIDHTYTLVPTKKDIYSVIAAIKHNQHKLVTNHLSLKTFFEITMWIISGFFIHKHIIVKTFQNRIL